MRNALSLLLLLGACAPLTSPERVDVLSAEVQAVRGLKAKQRIVVEALDPPDFNRQWSAMEREANAPLLGVWASQALAASQPASSEEATTAPLAFYDPRAKKIFASRTIEVVASASGIIAAQTPLVSAIERALQDQYFNLATFLRGDSTDEIYARQGLLQADAELTTTAWLEKKLPGQPPAPAKAVSAPPHQILDPLIDIGVTEAISPIYRSIGWPGINALFAQPPTSTAQLFSASGLRGEYKPIHFGPAFWTADCKQHATDHLGPAMMRYFSPGAPNDLALHWLGDQVEVCQALDDSVQVVWSIEFRHSEDARTALENMRQRFLAGPHRLLDEEPDDFPLTPSTDRFVEPAWPIAGTQDHTLVVVWANLPLAQRKVGQDLRSMAFVFAPKLADRLELRRQAADAGDKKDYATCSRTFLEVAALGGDWTDRYHAACCFANAGDADAAFSELKLLYGTRFSALDTLLKDPDLDSLRDNPEWPKLLARLTESQKLDAKLVDPELHAFADAVQKEPTGDHRAEVARAQALIGNGKAHSADDYYAAAVVLLTSEALADVEQARAFANRAADMDPSFTEANHLTALAEDRRLVLIGQAQKFGTQRIKHNGRIELYPVAPDFYDAERAEWDMPPFEEMQQRVRDSAAASLPAVP